MAIHTVLIESPEGDQLIASDWQWGHDEVTHRAESGLGVADLWQIRTQHRLDDNRRPQSLATADFRGCYAAWNVVAEVRDTFIPGEPLSFHVRLYPDEMGEAALKYLNMQSAVDEGEPALPGALVKMPAPV